MLPEQDYLTKIAWVILPEQDCLNKITLAILPDHDCLSNITWTRLPDQSLTRKSIKKKKRYQDGSNETNKNIFKHDFIMKLPGYIRASKACITAQVVRCCKFVSAFKKWLTFFWIINFILRSANVRLNNMVSSSPLLVQICLRQIVYGGGGREGERRYLR